MVLWCAQFADGDELPMLLVQFTDLVQSKPLAVDGTPKIASGNYLWNRSRNSDYRTA